MTGRGAIGDGGSTGGIEDEELDEFIVLLERGQSRGVWVQSPCSWLKA